MSEINNISILDLVRHADSFIGETQNCVSAKSVNFITQDLDRMSIMVSFWRKQFSRHRTDPILDMPHYSPRPLPVPVEPDRVELKNGRCVTWCDLWIALRVELVDSDSRSLPNSFHAADADRVEPILSQMEGFVVLWGEDPELDLPDQQTLLTSGG